jgi:hypothetical protein
MTYRSVAYLLSAKRIKFRKYCCNPYLRQFVPAFLDAFAFQSNVPADPLLKAVTVLRELNTTGRRVAPDDAPWTLSSGNGCPTS